MNLSVCPTNHISVRKHHVCESLTVYERRSSPLETSDKFRIVPHIDHDIPFSQKKRDHIAVIPSYYWWVGRDSNSRPTD